MSKHFVKIPESHKAIKNSIGIGLMYLAQGAFDCETSQELRDKLVTVEFNLSPVAENYLVELLCNEKSKRRIFQAALVWISTQPEHVQNATI